MPNSSRPQTKVAIMLYMPIVDIASVIGAIVAANGAGAAASSSRVPWERWSCIAEAPEVLVGDQIPMRLAPTATEISCWLPLLPYIRKAVVAKNIGQTTPRTPL